MNIRHPLHRFDNDHCTTCNGTDLNKTSTGIICNTCKNWASNDYASELNQLMDTIERTVWRKILSEYEPN